MIAEFENVLLMYQRPQTPVFLLKNKDGKRFNIKENSNLIANRYKDIFKKELPKLKENKSVIDLPDLKKDLDVGFAEKIPVDGVFSIYLHVHQKIAAELADKFAEYIENNIKMFPSYVAYVRDRINPKLFHYSLSVALANSEYEIKKAIKGDAVNAFPMNYFSQDLLEFDTKQKLTLKILKENYENESSKLLYKHDPTGSYLDEEYRVAYFREDIALNAFNSYWHIAYPCEGKHADKERRGELFLYLNQQIIARYNSERLCATLPRVKPFSTFKDEIREGYFPKLRHLNDKSDWTGRPSKLSWVNIFRPDDFCTVTITDIVGWRRRIEKAIDEGSAILDEAYLDKMNIPANSQIDEIGLFRVYHKLLDVDLLGNMIQSNRLSPNIGLYGKMYNMGHIFTAFVHDPAYKFSEPMGIMGESALAPRDPMFYRWRAFIDELLNKFKGNLLYPESDLTYKDIVVNSVDVLNDDDKKLKNELHTFWTVSVIKVQHFDVKKTEYLNINFKHLDHTPFTYQIIVDNKSSKSKDGTVRIFIAPTLNENGEKFNSHKEQRRLFIELDKFSTTLKPGINTISRKSLDSSVTSAMEDTFSETFDKSTGIFSKCGWPHHLLIPKGAEQGVQFQLFVMVSDDNQPNNSDNLFAPRDTEGKVTSSYSGLYGKYYPDHRSMGYPFDRLMHNENKISDIVDLHSNMKIQDVLIKHENKSVLDPRVEDANIFQ